MLVQCQKCQAIYDDGSDPEGTLVPYDGLPQVTCPECIVRLRKELMGMFQCDTGHHAWDQKLRFPQWALGIIWPGPKGEAFADKPIRKFIREFCCEPIMSIM